MSPAQQPTRVLRKAQQAMSLVSDVVAEWVTEAPAPRPISAVRGRIRAPASGPLVAYESATERDFLMFCRTDHRVVQVQAQQLRLHYTERSTGKRRRYTPDFVVDARSGAESTARWVVEVKRRADLFRARRAIRLACAAAQLWSSRQSNTRFAVITDRAMSGYWLENTRLLSGALDELLEVEVEAAARAVLLSRPAYRISVGLAAARQRGLNPERVLPTLYRMVARGELYLDRGQPITPHSWVTAVETPK